MSVIKLISKVVAVGTLFGGAYYYRHVENQRKQAELETKKQTPVYQGFATYYRQLSELHPVVKTWTKDNIRDAKNNKHTLRPILWEGREAILATLQQRILIIEPEQLHDLNLQGQEIETSHHDNALEHALVRYHIKASAWLPTD